MKFQLHIATIFMFLHFARRLYAFYAIALSESIIYVLLIAFFALSFILFKN